VKPRRATGRVTARTPCIVILVEIK
jgi:hypothetical protein